MYGICIEVTSGYLHSQYARSLSEFGLPRVLPHCRGWVLERDIPGTSCRDAMGCYPLFACHDWSQLETDLAQMADELVSVSLVTDPFGGYDRTDLEQCFPDKVIPFKEHFCVDLDVPMDQFVCRHHRRYARKALQVLQVQCRPGSPQLAEEWAHLYEHLIRRHGITGITAFSRSSFAKQWRVPGLVAFQASYDDIPIGMLLWYVQGEVAYYHLGAHSPLGYDLHSSHALFWRAIEYFSDRGLKWLNLGAGAGMVPEPADGLSRFKRGWSTGTRTAYFCGRIFDRREYARIAQARGVTHTDYFPAYRQGEFA